jgi:hypothetical protein
MVANLLIDDVGCANKIISSGLIDNLKIWCSTNLRVLFSMLASDLAKNRFITCFILAYNYSIWYICVPETTRRYRWKALVKLF